MPQPWTPVAPGQSCVAHGGVTGKKDAVNGFIRFVFAILIGCTAGAASAQNGAAGTPPRPWVDKPSAALAAKLQHWRLKLDPDETVDAPEKGAFPSFTPTRQDVTARLVNDQGPSAPVRLKPAKARTRYMPPWAPRTDPKDVVVTREILDLLQSGEITSFIAAGHFNNVQLDVERNFSVALVQEFDVAFRTPRKKEHVWSINWRIDNEWIAARDENNKWTTTRNDNDIAGFEGWGLFTKVNGVLKPFHLVASKYEYGGHPYYYVLAMGDLDGDGIDELVVRRMEFEAEDDNLELWSWEHAGPVTIQQVP